MPARNGRGVAVLGNAGAAVVAALVLVPGLRIGATAPWLGALIIIVPTAALLTATGYRHYGFARALGVSLSVSVIAGAVSWVVAVFTLVKALSGEPVGLAWAVLLFLTPLVSVLALGLLALRVVPTAPPR
nr:hypothetical protein [Mycolicibacterium malmesburyense]CRL78533.1 hypothetical protein CPGR_04761 [Mycolicibacterium malmesburyense]